ncbi:imidazole glycerol phosphate synthase subunit HisH [Paenibacillus apiarius]|uniref:Imidazole glycerol phosphate synthase subunit HisH n=1 Tax=Paenibacillus apiarius TaxID=46240 RepID=A0ABT4DVQ3_9BACL|nr:imidazole glycerol phosphate synthase subunit HisH [Paenibacillus apiarius]MCY9515302.1 imidazole glycerol phosphate synthase subunit HisH [Paenibacillus apiarius]MCY9520051.1 imidazole glycerol phosphate synthase subunit HisH [Paenibacillus apiarius]MCY9554326.1 imidazole glycerol phosphate synthase subunit HisH [Paenibacillus apiarius]MCY9558117.1 imidazole glycerol phosphate synthase subunit HisH [Paenibacillus apiarius]MCY9684912.1 imidazole glycerol phosphate synthase subunit HisH [Pae
MIAVIDYGMGNLHSVSKAVERLGYEVKVTNSLEEMLAADGIILPGVGAFGDAMQALQDNGLDVALCKAVEAGKRTLGICLGMQLLFNESEEHGQHRGLGLLSGRVVRFEGGSYKVPHMGWNPLTWRQPAHPLTEGLEEGHVYFVHSFHVLPDSASGVIATCSYGGHQVASIVGRDNVCGMQFHPEKSGSLGLQLLERFLKLTDNARN